ncbi:two-component system response regulator [Desulfosporosinus meridiei]|uniref:Stage 0 sporulation protein A homolog n=1 Tax=Desulfosporosinus meridiei (strain ATCC BAA-275 / DSM 13257 / KCTC 12902 / NCIMB 13706 / S10) TaxID=768704 RepID=J7J386_DESMD|nr:EAL domain-containing protein [Desulfosporosinus meridiei]AFQ45431.1 EAL domain-containing protein [Desulfosporosinus meridiei DSM 13257]
MDRKNSILIVDDSISGQKVLNALLEREDYYIEFASNGKEALKKAFEIKPDLVLLDVILPDMDGFEVCKRIRNNPYTSLMPVIMVTALEDRASKLKGFQSGADEFLCKPLDALEVKARVRTVLKLDRFRRLLYDQSTGLPNDMLFIDYIDNIMIRQDQSKTCQFAIVAVKLSNSMFLNNYLSKINDRQMLKGLVEKFQNGREDVKIISYNKEGNFTILLHSAGPEQAARFADDLVKAFANPIEYLNGELLLSCKIGISLYPQNGSTGNELVNNARLANEEKNKEKFYIRFYDEQLERNYKNHVEIATNLFKAIDNREFVLHFQPQVRADNHKIVGMEALIRWNSRDYGFMFPDFFIHRAEENGTIINLGNWVIKDSMRYLAELTHNKKISTSVSVNVSALQFNDPSLEARISNFACLYDLAPETIKIEITESAIIANPDEAQKKMYALKEKGFKLSIDDFGTGQATLAYLKDYPIDEIKIDKVFVQNCLTQKVDYEIVKHIIELAKTLNLKTVAEGVEEEKHVELLANLGCDIMQGYYFSKPVGENEMSNLLLTQPFEKQ